MTTKVVNIHHKVPYDVYIGRPGKGKAGPLGNPIIINEVCPVCDKIHTKAGDTLPCYKKYLEWRVDCDTEFRQMVLALRGKTLGCFCNDVSKCHGGVIIDWLEKNDT